MQKCLNVQFTGMVQGVGFRFTTQRIARQFQVTGFVRNLPNGKVQVTAEGEEKVLEDFLKEICESSLGHYIRDVETEWTGPEGKFRQFEILS